MFLNSFKPKKKFMRFFFWWEFFFLSKITYFEEFFSKPRNVMLVWEILTVQIRLKSLSKLKKESIFTIWINLTFFSSHFCSGVCFLQLRSRRVPFFHLPRKTRKCSILEHRRACRLAIIQVVVLISTTKWKIDNFRARFCLEIFFFEWKCRPSLKSYCHVAKKNS